MDLAKVQVSGIHARVAFCTGISSGIVGAKVLFDYTDPLWDGLIKNVVFEGAQTVSILNAGEEVALPAEVATDAGVEIRVGVCGVKPDGQMIIPTLWASLGIVQDAVPVDLGEEAKDPVPPVWAQLEAMIGDLGKLTTEEKTNLVAAVNELAQRSGGNADPEEVRRIVEAYLAENPPKGEKGDPGSKGEKGEPGDDYVLTPEDKTEIAEMAAELVDVPEGGTPQMKPLTFTGAVNATYDGSKAVSVEIPQGEGGVTPTAAEKIVDYTVDADGAAATSFSFTVAEYPKLAEYNHLRGIFRKATNGSIPWVELLLNTSAYSNNCIGRTAGGNMGMCGFNIIKNGSYYNGGISGPVNTSLYDGWTKLSIFPTSSGQRLTPLYIANLTMISLASYAKFLDEGGRIEIWGWNE